MDLSQSQEQDKIIQYYLNQQIKKVADEKSQINSQLEQERNRIKLQVWELINQKEQQVQEIQQSRLGATPLSLISNNSAQSDRFDLPMDRSKLKQQSQKFEQSIPSQKEQSGFQMTYHSFIDPTNKDYKYKQLDQLIAQYEEKTKNLPRNYFLKNQDQGSSQLQQDHEDDQYDQEFEQDEDIQEVIEEDLQESQVQVESQSIKQKKQDNINAYNNLSRLRVDRLDTSMANADNKLNEMSRLSESLSDLNVNETNKILEISKQVDAIKLSKLDHTLQYTKEKDDKLELSGQASKFLEISQQQSKFLQRLDYPQMPSLDQNFSYQVSEQSQLGRTQKQFAEQSKCIDQKQEQSQFKINSNQRSLIDQQTRIENQNQQNSKINSQTNSEFQERPMDYNQLSFQQQSKAIDHSHLPSKMSEPTKRNQQSECGKQNYFPNQTCANSNATSNKQQISESANKEEEFQFQFEDNNNENQFAEEEEVFSEEEDDHKDKFYQFSIKFEDQDEKEKLKKFEALKKKKIQEMEELRQLRQLRNKDANNNNKRDPSPLMPSASLKRLQPQFQQPQIQPQQYQQPQRNIFQEQPSPAPVPQAKRTTSANRKSPMARQKETAHFNDIDRSISIEKNKQNNKKMLKNAITYVCLAGEPNRKERESILQKLDGVEAEHFILLFKTYGRSDFRGLYGYAVDSQPYLIFGQGKCPQLLSPDMVKTFYKYDSGAKQFKAIDGNKQFTIMVDAVQLRK